jgi:hypothetical protein
MDFEEEESIVDMFDEEFENINKFTKRICHFDENHLFILGLQKKNYREIGLFGKSI